MICMLIWKRHSIITIGKNRYQNCNSFYVQVRFACTKLRELKGDEIVLYGTHNSYDWLIACRLHRYLTMHIIRLFGVWCDRQHGENSNCCIMSDRKVWNASPMIKQRIIFPILLIRKLRRDTKHAIKFHIGMFCAILAQNNEILKALSFPIECFRFFFFKLSVLLRKQFDKQYSN